MLLAEDLPFDTELTLRVLEKFEGRFDILIARDGADALLIMKHRKFDLILLDLKMPRMDGFETLMLMNAYQLQKGVPVIILSISDTDADRARARKLGAVGYIQKSTDLRRFEASLQMMIESYDYL